MLSAGILLSILKAIKLFSAKISKNKKHYLITKVNSTQNVVQDILVNLMPKTITLKQKKGDVMLYYQLLKEQEVLSQRETEIRKILENYPEGKLIYSQNGKHKKWYKSCNGVKSYIPSRDINIAVALAEKKYYEAILLDVVWEKKAVENYLKVCNKGKTQQEKIVATSAYTELLKRGFISSKEELAKWERADYEKCSKYPEQLVHPVFDGQKVRSKSEAIIATMLHLNKIPFHYEEALHFGNKVIYPDFTIRHPVTGRIYYWEHFGMMDNDSYAQPAFQKMQLYNINGILLSDTLLTTYETQEIPLKTDMVENMIHSYFM